MIPYKLGNTGSISCTSIPGAGIWLDGKYMRTSSPHILTNISIGNHIITFRQPGYIDCSVTVNVIENSISEAFCTLKHRGEWAAHPPHHVLSAGTITNPPSTPSPSKIKSIYNLPASGGIGTIAIIDAYDNPTVENDLNVFSNQFGLPPCTIVNGQFEKHMMSSNITTNSAWLMEIALDTQWAHAIAPNAKILLVEANTNNWNDLMAAVDYARNRSDVVAISMSFSGSEWSGETSYDYHFTSPYGAIFFASSGDSGTGTKYPAASPNVVGVGGTNLKWIQVGSDLYGLLDSEIAWSGSGGGLSVYESEPLYQRNYNVPSANNKRAIPDVSANAGGVAVYLSTPYNSYTGWFSVGGTSESAPIWAAIHALGHSVSHNNIYQIARTSNYSKSFRDIVNGTNGTCGFYCTAMVGYDYVTGLGSPLTTNFNVINCPSPICTLQIGLT